VVELVDVLLDRGVVEARMPAVEHEVLDEHKGEDLPRDRRGARPRGDVRRLAHLLRERLVAEAHRHGDREVERREEDGGDAELEVLLRRLAADDPRPRLRRDAEALRPRGARALEDLLGRVERDDDRDVEAEEAPDEARLVRLDARRLADPRELGRPVRADELREREKA
jgi:hypothetical protein